LDGLIRKCNSITLPVTIPELFSPPIILGKRGLTFTTGYIFLP
jgi:hypothetical protein